MPPVRLQSSDLSLDFDVTNGIGISRIHDVITGHSFLDGTRSLFELAPDNDGSPCPGNGVPIESSNGLTVDRLVTAQTTLLEAAAWNAIARGTRRRTDSIPSR